MQQEEYICQQLNQILSEIQQLKTNLLQTNNSPPLNSKQAADYLHISVSRLYELVQSEQLISLQHHKKSRLLFSTQQLQKYLYGSKT